MSSLTRIDLFFVESRMLKLLSQFLIGGLLISAITVANVAWASDFDPGAGYQGGYDPQAAFPTVFGYSGQSRFAGPNKPVKKWFIENFYSQNTPLIGRDGTIYITTNNDPELKAIGSDGVEKWTLKGIHSHPTISSDGTIYAFGNLHPDVSTNINFLYAITPLGVEKWRTEVAGGQQPSIGADGTIYALKSGDLKSGGLAAINPDGSEKWKLEAGFDRSPIVGKDGTIYLVKQSNNGEWASFVVAINPDGTKKWESKSLAIQRPGMYAGVSGMLALGNDGSIYASNLDTLVALKNSTGEVKWKFDLTPAESAGTPSFSPLISSPVVSKDGTVYFYTSEWNGSNVSKKLYALSPEGSVKWIYQHKVFNSYPGINDSRLVIDANGVIYTGFESGDGGIVAINPDGTLKWQFKDEDLTFRAEGLQGDHFGVSPGASIAIGSDGTLYFSAMGNKHVLYALGDDATSCLGKHATLNTKTGLVTIPALDIPTLDPFTGESTGKLATFSAQLNLLKGVEDFGLVSNAFKVLQVDVTAHDLCHAEYTYADGKFSKGGTIHLPYVDVPSVIVIPPNTQIPGPTQVYDATLRQLALDSMIFHLADYKLLGTLKP